MMKRAIYMVFTIVTALSMGGCSSALTTNDLTIIEEAEECYGVRIAALLDTFTLTQ